METGMEASQIKEMVRARYGGIAETAGDCGLLRAGGLVLRDTAPGTTGGQVAGRWAIRTPSSPRCRRAPIWA